MKDTDPYSRSMDMLLEPLLELLLELLPVLLLLLRLYARDYAHTGGRSALPILVISNSLSTQQRASLR